MDNKSFVLADVENDGLLFIVVNDSRNRTQKFMIRADVEEDLAANPETAYLGLAMTPLKAMVSFKREEIELALLQLPKFCSGKKMKLTKNDRWFLGTRIKSKCAGFRREIFFGKRRKTIEGRIDSEMAKALIEGDFFYIGDIIRESYENVKKRTQLSTGQMCELTLIIRLNGFDFNSEIPGWIRPEIEPAPKKKVEKQELLDLPIEEDCLIYEEQRYFRTGQTEMVTQRIRQETAKALLESGYRFIGDLVLSTLAEISEKSGLSIRQAAHISRILHHFGLLIGMKTDWQRPA